MNSIIKHLHETERSVAWLCRKFGFSRKRFHRLMQMSDSELYGELTVEELDKIKSIIPNLKTKLEQGTEP